MDKIEVITLVITIVSLTCFCIVFTVLFSHYCKGASEEVTSGKKDIELLDNELMTRKAKKKKSKASKYVKKSLSYGILVILLFMLGVSIYSKVTNDVMPLGNTAMLTVASGSMSKKNEANPYLDDNNLNNQFQTYDLILVHKVKESDLKLYDVIAYRNEKNVIIIHRIIKIDNSGNQVKYYTRGDANNATDDFVPTYKDIVGRYTNQRVPIIGMFVLFLQSYSGLVTVIAVAYCIWMFDHYYSRLRKDCYERIGMLLNVIKDPLDIKEFKTSYIQYIYYQGNIYEFNNGEFIKKAAGNLPIEDKTMYVVSKDNEDIKISAQSVEENKSVDLSPDQEKKTLEEIENKLKE